jgi:O-methyltransferase
LRSFPPAPDDPRPLSARGPRGREGPRGAYLDLLKLGLCDLLGAETRTVARDQLGVFSRRLEDQEQLRRRVDGSDWPLNALTMIGLRRLDDLQARIEELVADGIGGDLIEVGAWRGGASILMRATLDSLGDGRELVVADDTFDTDLSATDYFAPGLHAVKGYFERFGVGERVRFVPGVLEETMATLGDRRWALIRLGAARHGVTRPALDTLYGGLARGGYVVIDDYFTPGLDARREAVDGFRADHGIEDEIVRVDGTGARWRKRAEAETDLAGAAPSAAAPSEPREQWPSAAQPIPTDRERLLESALEQRRERIAQLDAALQDSRRVSGPRWLRRG